MEHTVEIKDTNKIEIPLDFDNPYIEIKEIRLVGTKEIDFKKSKKPLVRFEIIYNDNNFVEKPIRFDSSREIDKNTYVFIPSPISGYLTNFKTFTISLQSDDILKIGKLFLTYKTTSVQNVKKMRPM